MRAGENDSICHSKISKCHQQKIIVEVFLHQLHWWCSRQKSEFERNWKLKAALSRLSQRFSNGTATYKHRLLLCEPRLKETSTGSQSPGTFSWPQFLQLMPFFILPCWIFQWKNISNVFSDLRFLLFWWKRFLGRISLASLLLIGLPHPLSYIPNPLNEPLFHFQADYTNRQFNQQNRWPSGFLFAMERNKFKVSNFPLLLDQLSYRQPRRIYLGAAKGNYSNL